MEHFSYPDKWSTGKNSKERNAVKEFLQKKGVTLSPREYFITALSYMALGLFSSLIIGLIMKTLGSSLKC